MQTFLPYPSFVRSARVLDYRRLGKQRIEAKQILLALQGNSGWKHHPAVLMWKHHEYQLCQYAIAMCLEWRRRGYVDNQLDWFRHQSKQYRRRTLPSWIGRRQFHASHRSNLLRKDKMYYKKFKWNEPSTMEYVWPNKSIG